MNKVYDYDKTDKIYNVLWCNTTTTTAAAAAAAAATGACLNAERAECRRGWMPKTVACRLSINCRSWFCLFV